MKAEASGNSTSSLSHTSPRFLWTCTFPISLSPAEKSQASTSSPPPTTTTNNPPPLRTVRCSQRSRRVKARRTRARRSGRETWKTLAAIWRGGRRLAALEGDKGHVSKCCCLSAFRWWVRGRGGSQESAAVTFPVVLQAVQDQLAELPGRTRLSGRVEIERNGKEKIK